MRSRDLIDASTSVDFHFGQFLSSTTLTTRRAPNTRTREGMQRGTEKGNGRVYTVRPLFISFFFHLNNVLTSTTAPPPAEHEERALYGAFFVFGGSYGLPHPTEHEKRDIWSRFSCLRSTGAPQSVECALSTATSLPQLTQPVPHPPSYTPTSQTLECALVGTF